jgi:hypothetical protein
MSTASVTTSAAELVDEMEPLPTSDANSYGGRCGAIYLLPISSTNIAAGASAQRELLDAVRARGGLLGLETGDAPRPMEDASQCTPRSSSGEVAGAPVLTPAPPQLLPALYHQATATPPSLLTPATCGASDRSGSATLVPQAALRPACSPERMPQQVSAGDLAERGLRVIHIPSDGHCLFVWAFSA